MIVETLLQPERTAFLVTHAANCRFKLDEEGQMAAAEASLATAQAYALWEASGEAGLDRPDLTDFHVQNSTVTVTAYAPSEMTTTETPPNPTADRQAESSEETYLVSDKQAASGPELECLRAIRSERHQPCPSLCNKSQSILEISHFHIYIATMPQHCLCASIHQSLL